MKILVVSDTHGRESALEEAYLNESPDAVIFLGDGIDDMERFGRVFPAVPVYLAKGNCDLFCGAPQYVCETLGGVKIFACHGHRHDVKYGLSALKSSARSMGARLALYGHTHKQNFSDEGGLALLNPGSLGFGGDYAVITAEGGAFECELKTL